MLPRVDLDLSAAASHREWRHVSGDEELHGNGLGVDGIETFADDLKRFLAQQECMLIFTRVEKRHVASTKFADTLLDSGVNRAVSNLHYGSKVFRLSMALALATNLSPRSQEKFWDVYEKGDAEGFCEVLRRVQWNVRARVTDRRMRELLLDAVSWALQHLQPLLETTRSELDSPNIIAFSQLTNAVHHTLEPTGDRVERFIHDEQNQFARYLRQSSDYLRRVASLVAPWPG